MPFKLHPSGYCCYFSDSTKNLIAGCACRYCKRVAGHALDCPDYKAKEPKHTSSRSQLYNAVSVLWAKNNGTNFYTFTLPSSEGGTYQRATDCPVSGDLAIAEKFSKVLEAWSVRVKRSGRKLSYVWVAEAQTKRQLKFGGVGDIHFHLVASEQVKAGAFYMKEGKKRYRMTDQNTFDWLQSLWCSHVGVNAANCVDVDYIPPAVNSIPAYLSKYMGKGTQRKILSRQFAATRDLSRFRPVTLVDLPQDCELIKTTDLVFDSGFELTQYYYRTSDVLELYGHHMARESELNGGISGKHFTPDKIMLRAFKRQQRQLQTLGAGSSNPT